MKLVAQACDQPIQRDKRSRPLAVAAVTFGCALMLLGAFEAGILVVQAYRMLATGAFAGIGVGSSAGTVNAWAWTLLPLFGGNLLRSRGAAGLRRGRVAASTPEPALDNRPRRRRWTMARLMALQVAPLMGLWGVLHLVSVVLWVSRNRPPGGLMNWPSIPYLSNCCWSWLAGMALLVGSALLFSIGSGVVWRRNRSTSHSPPGDAGPSPGVAL